MRTTGIKSHHTAKWKQNSTYSHAQHETLHSFKLCYWVSLYSNWWFSSVTLIITLFMNYTKYTKHVNYNIWANYMHCINFKNCMNFRAVKSFVCLFVSPHGGPFLLRVFNTLFICLLYCLLLFMIYWFFLFSLFYLYLFIYYFIYLLVV
jgi:hypothetical protein